MPSLCNPLRTFGLALGLLLVTASPPATARAPGEIRIGVLDFLGSEATVGEWSPLLHHIEAALPGQTVRLEQLDHAGMRAAAAAGELDFIITNPGHYVELEAELGASRILTLDAGHGRTPARALGSAVVVRADRSDLQSLIELRGKRVAAVGREGFGGFQLIWGVLADIGVSPDEDFAELQTVGFPMSKVLEAVASGRADAGIVRACLLEGLGEAGRAFRVVAPREEPGFPCATSTPLYPDWPLASLRHTPPELARQVAIALLSMDADSDHPTWAVPADYQSVHDLFRKLEIGPYAYLREPTLMVMAQRYWPWVAGFTLVLLGWILYTVRVEYLVKQRTAALSAALAERDRLESAARAAQEQADHLARLSVLGELSGTLAHELNQPLATIANYANSIIRRADNGRLTDAALREATTEIAAQAERASGILSRIRSFARKRTATREAVAPAELAGEAIALFRGMMARAPEIALIDTVRPDSRIEVDRLQVQQVLLNLLKNAYDASRELPPERQPLEVRLAATDGGLDIQVRDRGVGIDDATRARLFEPFFTTKTDGLGLGLSICRSIAEAHGGRLVADTPADRVGTCFTLSLPGLQCDPTHE
ncbi:sensor histidine kinase [Thauera propionica]|uniref:sensor histidine kinase n=1 Tax=Thauera propionica TaxID=2019431 RepID=UPI0023F5401E|nr:PhnD/SsuA/transferrin family substrate-binding protein [Thauera propionica]MDD3675113.1 PhnD/SsuA/transferrin family substrate-binding protein [Thauera propionica]